MKTGKKTACIIPARYGSTRLPAKPLLRIKSLPLIMWVYNRAEESQAFDDVYVATDDERIFSTVEQYRGKAIMTSVDCVSGTDRVWEAIQNISCDYVVNMQGDEPDVPVELLQIFTKTLATLDTFTLLTCVSNATINEMADPNVVKAVLDSEGKALYFSRAPIPYPRDKAFFSGYKHIGIYGFCRDGLRKFCTLSMGTLEQVEKLEQLRALEYGMKIQCLIGEYNGKGIDTEEDYMSFRARVGDI